MKGGVDGRPLKVKGTACTDAGDWEGQSRELPAVQSYYDPYLLETPLCVRGSTSMVGKVCFYDQMIWSHTQLAIYQVCGLG